MLVVCIPNLTRAQFAVTLELGFDESAENEVALLEHSQEVTRERLRQYDIDLSLYQLEIENHRLKIHLNNRLKIPIMKQLILTKGKIEVQAIYDLKESRVLMEKVEDVFTKEIRPKSSQEVFIQKYGLQEGDSIWNSVNPLKDCLYKSTMDNLSVDQKREHWIKDLFKNNQLKTQIPDLPPTAWKHHPDKALELFFLKGQSLTLTDYIIHLSYQYNNYGEQVININLDTTGTDFFAAMTEMNVGQKLAFMLDGTVLMAPTVQQVIVEGKISLTGWQFNEEYMNSKFMKSILIGGSLPSSIQLLSEDVYRP